MTDEEIELMDQEIADEQAEGSIHQDLEPAGQEAKPDGEEEMDDENPDENTPEEL